MTAVRHAPRERRAPATAGFTLLELVVVLIVAAAVAALSLPSGRRSLAPPALDAAATRLAAALRLAHAQAIRTNDDHLVVIDPVEAAYRAPAAAAAEHLPAGVTLSIEQDGLEWTGEKRLVRFRPDGTASSAVIALTGTSGRTRISLDGLTGSVRIDPERR